ncbi:MAG: hypothetical protein ACK4N5_05490 [Myxococcales bacterium]
MTQAKGAFLLAVCLLAGCAADSGGGDAEPPEQKTRRPVGDGCAFNEDCATNECHGAMPGGLCTEDDCDACPDGSKCAPSRLGTFCFVTCSHHPDCRQGYQCLGGACVPSCEADTDCARGLYCNAGRCEQRPSIVTGTCSYDGECPSKICLIPERKCSTPCAATPDCGATEYCVMRLYTNSNREVLTRATCSPEQPGGELGASCATDKDCRSGMCYLGACSELCRDGSCPAALTCQSSQYVAADGVKSVNVCLPAQGRLVGDFVVRKYGQDTETLPIPKNTASFSILGLTEQRTFTPAVLQLTAPDGRQLYSTPQTTEDFYRTVIRYYPDSHSSTMLVPNTPSAPIQNTGPYRFLIGAFNADGAYAGVPTVRVFYKLAPNGLVTRGTLNFNVYLANLSGHPCGSIHAGNAATELKSSFDVIRRIYAKANITIGTITYRDLPGNTFNSINTSDDAAMGNLFANSAGATNNAVNLFIVRSISPQGVLGVAGGIPGPPVHGTANSGVVASLANRCNGVLGHVLAHEVGHYLGLFHNLERDNRQDPIADSNTSAQNLMYWNEQGGEELSNGQSFVLLRNAIVE